MDELRKELAAIYLRYAEQTPRSTMWLTDACTAAVLLDPATAVTSELYSNNLAIGNGDGAKVSRVTHVVGLTATATAEEFATEVIALLALLRADVSKRSDWLRLTRPEVIVTDVPGDDSDAIRIFLCQFGRVPKS